MKKAALGSLFLGLLFIGLGLGRATAFNGDWASFRADKGYTGRATLAGQIDKPGLRWNMYLGGAHQNGDLWIGPLGADGTERVAGISGGKVVVKNTADEVLWISPAIAASTLVGAYDFDGDGAKELLVARYQAPAALYLFDAQNGTLLWRYADFTNTATSFPGYQIIVTDLNGDQKPDIVCKPDQSLQTYAFSFAQGFKTNPAENVLWSYTHTKYHNVTPYVVGDLDGDGTPEVVFFEYGVITILDGASGALKQQPNVFNAYSFGLMRIVTLGNDPQPRLLAIGNSGSNADVLLYNAKTKAVEWAYQWDPALPQGKALSYAENSFAELDQDGTPEVVISVWNDTDDETLEFGSSPADHDGINAPGHWTLLVLNAKTGHVKASLADAYLRAVVPAAGGKPALVLAQQMTADKRQPDAFGTLTALRLTAQGLQEVSRIEHAALALAPSAPQADANAMSDAVHLLHSDADADGWPEVLVSLEGAKAGVAELLALYDLSVSPAVSRASYAVPQDETLTPVQDGIAPLSTGQAQLALFGSAGYVELFDGQGLTRQAKLRAGSFSPEYLVADLDNDGYAEVIVTNSRNELCVLETKQASLTNDPKVRFCYQGLTGQRPMTVDAYGNGQRQLLVKDLQDPNTPVLRLLDAGGTELWNRSLPGYGGAPSYLIPGRLHSSPNLSDNSNDILIVGYDHSKPEDKAWRMEAISALDGHRLWEIAPQQNAQMLTPPIVKDINGDFVDDVLWLTYARTESYNGLNGALIDSIQTYWARSGVLLDFDGNGKDELLETFWGASEGISLYSLLNAPPLWTVPVAYNAETDTRWPGLIALGNGKYGFIKPTSMGLLTAFDSAGQPLWGPNYVRQGQVQATDFGAPTNISGLVVGDVNGDGREEALLGSADGYLLALDALNGTLVFSLNLNAPVSEPILADVDHDGKLDILVGTGDGQLHMISGSSLSSVGGVRAVALNDDLSLGDTSVAITQSEYGDALGCAWDLPAAASGAFVTVADENGTPLGSWKDLKAAKSAVVDGIYNLGKSYRVWVMSYAANGDTGAVAQSAAVSIVDLTPPKLLQFFHSTGYITGETPTEFGLLATDRTGLASFTLSLTDRANTVVFNSARPAEGTRFERSQSYVLTNSQGGLLPEGVYTAQMEVKDKAGHNALGSIELRVLRSNPPKPLILQPTNGAHLTSRTVTVDGTGPLGSAIKVVVDGKPFCESAAVSSDLHFECANAAPLADGWHVMWAVAVNEVGRESELSEMLSFGIDATLPSAPTITVPAENAALRDLRPTFKGLAEAASVVTVYNGATSQDLILCVTVADTTGDFSCAATFDLQVGAHQVVARAVDDFGNPSALGTPVDYVIKAQEVTDGDLDSDSSEAESEAAESVDGDTSEAEIEAEAESEAESEAQTDGDADKDQAEEEIIIEPIHHPGGGCQAPGTASGLALVALLVALGCKRRFFAM